MASSIWAEYLGYRTDVAMEGVALASYPYHVGASYIVEPLEYVLTSHGLGMDYSLQAGAEAVIIWIGKLGRLRHGSMHWHLASRTMAFHLFE